MPLGMIVVRDDFFITVSLRKNKVIEDFENVKLKIFKLIKNSFYFSNSLFEFFLFLTNLKQINKETEIAEYILKIL